MSNCLVYKDVLHSIQYIVDQKRTRKKIILYKMLDRKSQIIIVYEWTNRLTITQKQQKLFSTSVRLHIWKIPTNRKQSPLVRLKFLSPAKVFFPNGEYSKMNSSVSSTDSVAIKTSCRGLCRPLMKNGQTTD